MRVRLHGVGVCKTVKVRFRPERASIALTPSRRFCRAFREYVKACARLWEWAAVSNRKAKASTCAPTRLCVLLGKLHVFLVDGYVIFDYALAVYVLAVLGRFLALAHHVELLAILNLLVALLVALLALGVRHTRT